MLKKIMSNPSSNDENSLVDDEAKAKTAVSSHQYDDKEHETEKGDCSKEAVSSGSDSDETTDDEIYFTDNDYLRFGPYSWRQADRWNGREVYLVSLWKRFPREKAKCLEVLDKIGCIRERYLGLSVEEPCVFFANLNVDEAARVEDLEDVCYVAQRRFTVSDVG